MDKFALPAFLIDDGSDDISQEVLAEAEKKFLWLTVHHIPKNLGKGGAVRRGLELAFLNGFTHAVQMDSDGQHCVQDLPKFVEAIGGNPDALVLGVPVFDSEIPKSRLYGRLISRAFVWLETLSFSIKDPLCGFRGYPLGPCLQLMQKVRLGQGMDFDPEIVVRLFWRGVPIRSVNTPVAYFKDGVSHFKLLIDNWRISWMHARLVTGMFLRLPFLLNR